MINYAEVISLWKFTKSWTSHSCMEAQCRGKPGRLFTFSGTKKMVPELSEAILL